MDKENCRHLKLLDVAFCGITDLGLQYIAKCRSLRMLRLSGVVTITVSGLKSIAEGCKMLEKLEMKSVRNLSGVKPPPGTVFVKDPQSMTKQYQEQRNVSM